MILEKQVELLILSSVMNNVSWKSIFEFDGNKYEKVKLINRYKELMKEFLEPYALNSGSRGH